MTLVFIFRSTSYFNLATYSCRINNKFHIKAKQLDIFRPVKLYYIILKIYFYRYPNIKLNYITLIKYEHVYFHNLYVFLVTALFLNCIWPLQFKLNCYHKAQLLQTVVLLCHRNNSVYSHFQIRNININWFADS